MTTHREPQGKHYVVKVPGRATNLRPNRVAAGMTKTVGTGHCSDDALFLVVHGTCDRIGGNWSFKTTRLPCPCCGHRAGGKLSLTERGRLRLRVLRNNARQRASTQENA